MSISNQLAVSLVGVGGAPPYIFTIIYGPNTTIPATISGSTLTVDASALGAGAYSVEIQIADQASHPLTKVISIQVADPSQFTILTCDLGYGPSSTPASVYLTASGGQGTLTWSLLPAVTTLPGATVSPTGTLAFTPSTFGEWAVGVRATDSVGNSVTKVFSVDVVAASVTQVAGGQFMMDVSPNATETGTHQFTLAVTDSNSTTKRSTFNYVIEGPVSALDVPETSIDYFWGAGDKTSIVYPITGNLSGFALGSGTTVTASNGLTVVVDPATGTLQVTGPPTSFGNAEVAIPITVVQGSTQVATITREFTLVSHSGNATSLGTMTCRPRPYIVGDTVGLNPSRPYYNSPSIFPSAGLTVQLANSTALPQGLSLDSTTGLIYGKLLGNNVPVSILQYVDSTGITQGTITITWDILPNAFQLTDALTDGQIQVNYSASITTTSASPLTAVTLRRGALPAGMLMAVSSDQKSIQISGSPTSAGYYDLWFVVTNANGQQAGIYHRLIIDFIPPLVVATTGFFPLQAGVAFTQTLQAAGGTAPYVWSIPSGVLPSGLSLNASTGQISGTTSVSSYNQLLTIQVLDHRGAVSSTVLPLALNNALQITTPVLPLITPGLPYQFLLKAQGGSAPYTWAIGAGSAALPGGFSLTSTGVLSGATSLSTYSANLNIQVTDASNNTTTQTFLLLIGVSSGLVIDTEGVGPIPRGIAYVGTLSVLGTGVAPYTWSVTTDSPNPIPSGLTLSAYTPNHGASALLSGQTTASLDNYSVKAQVVDANGNSAYAFLMLGSVASLVITTNSLPQATVGGAYSTQLTCSGSGGTYTWQLDPSSPAMPAGLTLTSGGLLAGSPTTAATTALLIGVSDTSGDYVTKTLSLVAVVSTLAITTTSLPTCTAGVAYGSTLAATGGVTPYTWSISPASASTLPTGLTLDTNSGLISQTTLQAAFDKSITFRVTDTIGVYREVVLELKVLSDVVLTAGPDAVASTSLGCLGLVSGGDVSGITPRPGNQSFYVVATNCNSTSASGLSFDLPTGFTATVANFKGGTALISLAGPFNTGGVGSNAFNMTINDSGVKVSAAFTWLVYPETPISIVPASGTLPTLYTD